MFDHLSYSALVSAIPSAVGEFSPLVLAFVSLLAVRLMLHQLRAILHI